MKSNVPETTAPAAVETKRASAGKRSALIPGVGVVLMILLLAAVAALWYGGEFDRESTLEPEGPPAFVPTVFSRATVSDDANVIDRLRILQYNIKVRLRRRSSSQETYEFAPGADILWGVQDLLNKCMEISGTKYLLAREGIGDEIDFGNTNTLNGPQWVAACEAALQRNGYVLIREKPKLVKVVPQHKLEDYRNAGLLKSAK